MKHFILSILLAFFSCASMALTSEETLRFLYSTLSLPDSADYPREFYERNVESVLTARRELPWGNSVPEREFLHFVVPVRVNNEALDTARQVFYRELKPRVQNLSMAEAILAVNHWCHEKVTYKPSDARTSSPLSCVSQAIGRCGEESTLCVAALRSVGIPARQIYTPRWAHTDDNHAWVEAWADGEWHFIGACEPEPVLDLAWFNAPASRGLLMSTNVAGRYDGPEEVLLEQPFTTRINVTSNYAPTGNIDVRVSYPGGIPAADAKVNFCIYNYAEFYPAVTKTADSNGATSLKCGLGDMLVWATDGNRFGFYVAHATDSVKRTPVDIVLDKEASYSGDFECVLTPPAPGSRAPKVSERQRNYNDMLLAIEDSVRNAYTSTFATPEQAADIARRLGLDPQRVSPLLVASRGNHAALEEVLLSLNPTERIKAIGILESVSEKDLRDIPASVIHDALENSEAPAGSSSVYYRYVLNPRIENEALRPWRRVLGDFFAQSQTEYRANPQLLADWIALNVADASAENPLRLRMSPAAVLSTRKADPISRNIFFVAAARSLGIPSRIDPVTSATQFLAGDGVWSDVSFSNRPANTHEVSPESKGALVLTFNPVGYLTDPKYYSHFSISKIENGIPRLLEFPEEGTLSSLFSKPYPLEAGQYLLTSGQRMADGSVLAHSDIFSIYPGETLTMPLTLRRDDTRLSVIGALNAENIYHNIAADSDKSLISTTGRGYYVIGLITPNHEPSAHAVNDIAAIAERLEKSGEKIMLLFDDAEMASRFNRTLFGKLPDNVVFGIDNNGTSRRDIESSLHLNSPDAPLFVIADTFNRIVWYSSGYSIGLGETLLRHLSELK